MFGNDKAQGQGTQDAQQDYSQPGDPSVSTPQPFTDTPLPAPGTAPAFSTPPSTPTDLPAPAAAVTQSDSLPSDELLALKQDALQQLTPLVDHLEQSPEEKFRTTMMMIQASDDQTLIKAAYEAAKQITDEKARAQALLDVVNEINYFTQQHNK